MKNLTERAYEVLSQALETGALAPGRRVSQQELCDAFSLSVTPLQGALKRLESDGLIRIKPRSGIIVNAPDLGQHAENHELRRILELACVRHFAETVPAELIDTLTRRIDDHLESLTHTDGAEPDVHRTQAEIEQELHGAIVRSKGNRTLWETYQSNMRRFRLIRPSRETLTRSHMRQTSEEHLAILHAGSRRDPQEAFAALEIHLTRSLERALMTRLHSLDPIDP